MNTGKRNDDAPTNEPGRDPGQDLEHELGPISDLYAELPGSEPPAALDHAVLRDARAALRPAARPWTFGWVHGLATAAVLALGLSIVLNLPDRTPPEPLRVAKPPAGKLRDTESEIQPLTLPAAPEQRQAGENGEVPTLRRLVGERSRPAAEAAPSAAEMSAAPALQKHAPQEPAREEPAPQQASGLAMDAADADPGPREEHAPVEPPEAWLERIAEMKAGGDPAWRSELESFRAAWPDHPVPDTLDG